jgi:hypothetical protein
LIRGVSLLYSLFVRLDSHRQYSLQLPAKVFVWTVVMGLLAPRQAEMAEAIVSWSRLRSRIAMIDSLSLAQAVERFRTAGTEQFSNAGLTRGNSPALDRLSRALASA